MYMKIETSDEDVLESIGAAGGNGGGVHEAERDQRRISGG